MEPKHSENTIAAFSECFSWFHTIPHTEHLNESVRLEIAQQLTEIALDLLEKVLLVYHHQRPTTEPLRYCDALEQHTTDYHQHSTHYPVLKDTLLPAIQRKLAYVTECLIQIQTHHQQPIKSVTLGCGDWHDAHLGTLQITFCDSRQYYYKCRSPEGEILFQNLCDTLNIDHHNPERHQIGSGYTESAVIWQPSTDTAGFYHHMGQYLALFYLLGAIDLHSTNLIAQQKPVFIDLETITHSTHPFGDWCDHYDLLHTLILPHISYRAGQHPGIDLSAIGFTGDQPWPDHVLRINDLKSTTPKLGKYTKMVPKAYNLPNHTNRNPWYYRTALLAGYHQSVAAITRHAQTLTDQLHATDACFRVLLRPTMTYSRLVKQANHPKLLADPTAYHQYFHQITRSRYAKALPKTLVNDEIQTMMQGNIPHFTAPINSTTLITKTQHHPNFFSKTALSGILTRLQQLKCPRFLACQNTLIEKSLEIAYHNRKPTAE